MWEFLKGLFEKLDGSNSSKRRVQYSVNEAGFSEIVPPGGGSGTVHLWSDVLHVGVLTTDAGPFFDDVFFVIKTKTGDICITSDDAQNINLLSWFERLPGFQWEKVVEAMASTDNASFDCWDSGWTTNAA